MMTRLSIKPSILLLAGPLLAGPLLAAGCAARDVPAARFANAPPVHQVDDRRDVAALPAEREFIHALYHYDGTVQRRLTRAMELPRPQRALGVNALDEVPDSTWFTNRIGVRDLTLDELRTGPAAVGTPELHRPWTVLSTKAEGTELNLILTDARGIRFLLKFDTPGYPEQVTATHVIAGKLLGACGLHVTDDYVVMFQPDDLVLAPDATSADIFDTKHRFLRPELDALLRRTPHTPGGGLRAVASRWLAGKPLGGPPAEGVREDDPNDRIPHQLRRDLRGAYTFFAWLEHVDVQEGNFLDTWVEDHGRHYVQHHLIDFGKAFGVMNTTDHDPRQGREYWLDFAAMGRSLGTLGLERRPWEGVPASPLRGVGMFDVDSFDPDGWKPQSPAYLPFLAADRFDKFWAAKILIRFTRDQIRAVVELGRLSDPRAADYLTDTLVARQRKTARTWFERVNPLDRFAVVAAGAGASLCFDDLAVVYGLGATAGATEYRVTAYDAAAHPLGPSAVARPDPAGHACTAALPPADYAILRIATARPGFDGQTFVHVARDPATGAPRVIGIWRA